LIHAAVGSDVRARADGGRTWASRRGARLKRAGSPLFALAASPEMHIV
jgi:uncharacterized protein Veg